MIFNHVIFLMEASPPFLQFASHEFFSSTSSFIIHERVASEEARAEVFSVIWSWRSCGKAGQGPTTPEKHQVISCGSGRSFKTLGLRKQLYPSIYVPFTVAVDYNGKSNP